MLRLAEKNGSWLCLVSIGAGKSATDGHHYIAWISANTYVGGDTVPKSGILEKKANVHIYLTSLSLYIDQKLGMNTSRLIAHPKTRLLM